MRNRTLANLSALPEAATLAVRRCVGGESLIPAAASLSIARTLPHGHAAAVIWRRSCCSSLPVTSGVGEVIRVCQDQARHPGRRGRFGPCILGRLLHRQSPDIQRSRFHAVEHRRGRRSMRAGNSLSHFRTVGRLMFAELIDEPASRAPLLSNSDGGQRFALFCPGHGGCDGVALVLGESCVHARAAHGNAAQGEELAGSACWLLASVARPRTHNDITAVTWSQLPLTTLRRKNLTVSIITLQSTAL